MRVKLSPRVTHLRLNGEEILWRPDLATGIVTDGAGIQLAARCDGVQELPEASEVNEFVKWLEDLELTDAGSEGVPDEPRQPRCRRIFLNLTNACNLRCRYCHAQSGKRGTNELTFEEWLSVIRQVPDLAPEGVTFTGGEPLLRSDTVAIARALRDLSTGLPLTLVTNGSAITSGLAVEVASVFGRVKVSVDSLPSINDSVRGDHAFERAMRGIVLLIEARAQVEINVTLTRQSLPSLDEFVAQLHGLGIQAIKFNPLWLTGSARSAPDLMYSTRELLDVIAKGGPAGQLLRRGILRSMARQMGADRQISCEVGDYLNIAYFGDVYPCHTLTFTPFRAANVRDTALLDIWKHSEVFSFVRSLHIGMCERCRTCDYRRICRGGCRGLAYQSGNLLGAPTDCAERLELWERLLPEVLPQFFFTKDPTIPQV